MFFIFIVGAFVIAGILVRAAAPQPVTPRGFGSPEVLVLALTALLMVSIFSQRHFQDIVDAAFWFEPEPHQAALPQTGGLIVIAAWMAQGSALLGVPAALLAMRRGSRWAVVPFLVFWCLLILLVIFRNSAPRLL